MSRLGWLVAIGVIGAAFLWRERQSDAHIIRLEQERDSLAAVAIARDTVYTVDTVRLTQVRTRHDTTWLATTDTLIHRDTVIQIVERERQACDAVIRTCEERVADRDRQIVNLDSLLILEKKRRPGLQSKLGWLLAGAAVGVLVK